MKKLIVIIVVLLSFGAIAQTKTISIQTSAQCEMCKEKIEKNLIYSKGVVYATLDSKTKIINVEYKTEKTNPDILRKIISDSGYDADSIPANEKVYLKLPLCCKKTIKND
jgi:copper chaperone CopZ